MTLTGDVYRDGTIKDAASALQEFLDRFMLRNQNKPVELPAAVESQLSDEEVLKKATYARNGG
jgi:hypothetical protein